MQHELAVSIFSISPYAPSPFGGHKNTFVLSNKPIQVLYPPLQLALDPLRIPVHLLQHLSLLFQLSIHLMCLLPQITHRPTHTLQRHILICHQLLLLLKVECRVRIISICLLSACIPALCAAAAATTSPRGTVFLQLLSDVQHLALHFVHEASPARYLGNVKAELVGVLLDCADGRLQVGYVGGKIGEILDEIGVGSSELGGGEGGCEGADAEVAGEGGASRLKKGKNITICGISCGPLMRSGEALLKLDEGVGVSG